METLRRLRQKSDLPVIFLTSKDEQIDELFGLNIDGEDLVTNLIWRRLLVAPVKAILRHRFARGQARTPKDCPDKDFERVLFHMDPRRHRAR